jgi:WhiB family redox-sensing transcriptional regulator
MAGHALAPRANFTSTSADRGFFTSGACREEDPELFFPVGDTGPAGRQREAAKAVCTRCPVRDACLRWALDTRQVDGVWGGTSEEERARIWRARQPARSKPRPAGRRAKTVPKAGPGVGVDVQGVAA